ncbi:MCE family protein [Saccharopolyspora gloriosae]|uniref:MCE family protein n=1 Tax=Saccharopolyspora gloriosae TaxID=455344 RepID=UPI001FB790AA|nr:MCE family protein [Saccharopolyspora gloriosae]
MSHRPRLRRARNQLLGLVFVACAVLFLATSVALYAKAFTPVVAVTLRTDRVGNQLDEGAEVKVRGLQVGEVRAVRTAGNGAEIDLAIEPEQAELLPGDVTARLLPKTLFGERYVSLVVPAEPLGPVLAAGDRIGQDRSGSAIELERVLADVLPTLRAVQPQKLATTLSAVSQALDGRGEQLGRTLLTLNEVLAGVEPELPNLTADLTALAEVSNDYADVLPDLTAALSDLSVTSRTVAEQRVAVQGLIADLTATSDDLGGFLREHGDDVIRLAADSRPTLESLARHAPEYPCLLRRLTELKPDVDEALGAGTGQPGLHVSLGIVAVRGGSGGGGLGSCSAPIPAEGGVGSPQEGRFAGVLSALSRGVPPESAPEWGGLLLSPVYRGAEVSLR